VGDVVTPTSRRVASTDPCGEMGRRVTERLVRAGVPQVLVAGPTDDVPPMPDAEVVRVDGYDDAAAMPAALQGVDTLYLIPLRETPDRARQHCDVVDAAVAAGVRRVVYHSFLGASARSTFTLARDHHATETHIRSAGCSFSIVRASAFMEVLRYVVGADGIIRGPAGAGRFAPIARDDVAEATAAVLTGGAEHEGATYHLTGPDLLTMGDVAARFAAATGRPISYHDESLEEAYASRRGSGAPDWQVEAWVTTYLQIARGELDAVTPGVEQLTGHPPVTLAAFLAAHPESLPD